MGVVLDNFDLYWHGFLKTLGICLWAGGGALVLGTVLGACRVSPIPPLRWTGTAYVTVVRNCPLTVVLFFVAFGLPEAGVRGQTYYRFAVAGLVVYTAAFVCEAVRSGINAVDTGQAEAARSVGLTFGQSLRFVVMPQALRSVVPPLGSVLIAMVKNSAIVGAFGVGGELFNVGASLTGAQGLATLPVLTGVVLGYLAITIPAGLGLQVLERKVAVTR
jgi:glutamate transport system permease protein